MRVALIFDTDGVALSCEPESEYERRMLECLTGVNRASVTCQKSKALHYNDKPELLRVKISLHREEPPPPPPLPPQFPENDAP